MIFCYDKLGYPGLSGYGQYSYFLKLLLAQNCVKCKSVGWVDKSKAFGKRGHKGIDNGSTSQSGEVASEAVPAEQ